MLTIQPNRKDQPVERKVGREIMATAWQSVIAFTSAVNYGLSNDGTTATTGKPHQPSAPISRGRGRSREVLATQEKVSE